jgi:hypothetical protein
VLVDLIAAVPSIVVGLWGLLVLSPVFANQVEPFFQKVPVLEWFFHGPAYGPSMLLAGDGPGRHDPAHHRGAVAQRRLARAWPGHRPGGGPGSRGDALAGGDERAVMPGGAGPVSRRP